MTFSTFRHDYALAVYVGALKQPATAACRKQRQADLAQAVKLIAGASAQAQHLSDMRYVSGLVAQARE